MAPTKNLGRCLCNIVMEVVVALKQPLKCSSKKYTETPKMLVIGACSWFTFSHVKLMPLESSNFPKIQSWAEIRSLWYVCGGWAVSYFFERSSNYVSCLLVYMYPRYDEKYDTGIIQKADTIFIDLPKCSSSCLLLVHHPKSKISIKIMHSGITH